MHAGSCTDAPGPPTIVAMWVKGEPAAHTKGRFLDRLWVEVHIESMWPVPLFKETGDPVSAAGLAFLGNKSDQISFPPFPGNRGSVVDGSTWRETRPC